MSHSAAIPLHWGRESVGYFSKQPATRLLVFVHGFGGGASSTWAGAETALVADPKANATDIVFYGYRSLRTQPEISAAILLEFLDEAASGSPEWNAVGTKALGHAITRSYVDILIVAHSLGAPVSRRAVLDAIIKELPWTSNIRLLLFAPAHMGAYLSRLQKELPGSVGVLIGSIVTFAKVGVLALDGLEPDSPFLRQLLDDSRRALDNGWKNQVRAEQVIFGDSERVVMTQRFLVDPPHQPWVGYGHCGICRCPKTVPTIARHL